MLKNAQWKFTKYGIEHNSRFHSYLIETDRLRDTVTLSFKDGPREVFMWPSHMAQKSWVDIELFIEIFVAALALTISDTNVLVLPDSLRLARKEASER